MTLKERVLTEYEKSKSDVLVICGPTASGKSSLALSLKDDIDMELVSADSMQIYRGMDIGTAKPSVYEQKAVRHHMIDILEPWENYNAFLYREQAAGVIRDIISRGKIPVVCGGTGLYINSLVDERVFQDDIDEKTVRFTNDMTPEERYEKLSEIDPDAAKQVHPNNEKRVKRFLDLSIATGKTLAERNE